MAVKIRLKRLGRTHRSFYRITVMDERNPRDGRSLEELGTYDPQNKVVELQLQCNIERARHWLSRGAVPSDTVRNLLKKTGINA